jgi:hypothetical protein
MYSAILTSVISKIEESHHDTNVTLQSRNTLVSDIGGLGKENRHLVPCFFACRCQNDCVFELFVQETKGILQTV